jgi:hypothetical protein
VLLDDLQASLRAWRRDPLLPVVSLVVLFGIELLPAGGPGGLIGAILGLLGLGWLGTERLWYRRIFDGTGVSAAELWSATWRFFPRFLIFSLVTAVVLIPTFVWTLIEGDFTDTIAFALSLNLAVASALVTFMLPALAFTSRRVRDGLRIGWRILKEDWRRCRWYALFPAGASLAAARLSFLEVAVPGPVWTALATVVTVAFDGAVVRYYLRRQSESS